jgi:chaperonin GroES
MTNIKPLEDRVLIKRSEVQKSKGGILLPDTAQEKPKEGVVIAVGPGKTDEDGNRKPLQVKVGDQVLFSSYAGTKIENQTSEEEYLIMKEEDLLGILVK